MNCGQGASLACVTTYAAPKRLLKIRPQEFFGSRQSKVFMPPEFQMPDPANEDYGRMRRNAGARDSPDACDPANYSNSVYGRAPSTRSKDVVERFLDGSSVDPRLAPSLDSVGYRLSSQQQPVYIRRSAQYRRRLCARRHGCS